MTSITDRFRDQFHALLLAEAEAQTFPEPVISLPCRVSPRERSLSKSMQQLQAVALQVSRILEEEPELAREWRAELLECGRHINYAIGHSTRRSWMPGVEEHQGRAPT